MRGSRRPLAQRMQEKTDKESSGIFWNGTRCHEWTGYTMPGGYGMVHRDGKTVTTHRAAWELVNGPIPEGQYVLHRCDNRKCVNVEHLFLGTFDDNMADMVRKNRQAHGVKNPHAKLNEDQVRAIRAAEGTHSAIAKQFGVSQPLISMIRNRRIWKLVDKR